MADALWHQNLHVEFTGDAEPPKGYVPAGFKPGDVLVTEDGGMCTVLAVDTPHSVHEHE